MTALEHISQAKLKHFQKLTSKKFRERNGQFIIEGVRLVEEALQSDWKVETLLVSSNFLRKPDADRFLTEASRHSKHLLEVTEAQLGTLTDTVNAQGIAAIVHQKKINH